jgi:hypothetical protein
MVGLDLFLGVFGLKFIGVGFIPTPKREYFQ